MSPRTPETWLPLCIVLSLVQSQPAMLLVVYAERSMPFLAKYSVDGTISVLLESTHL